MTQPSAPNSKPNRPWFRRLRLSGTPIFMYHGLSKRASDPVPAKGAGFWVLQDHFRLQLAQIRDGGYRTVHLQDFVASPGEPEGLVVLTFDDGNRSDYEVAFPALVEAGMKAVFFVNSSTIGTSGFLGWPEILEMQRGGMSFQSHGHNHMDFRLLGLSEMEWQLKVSKQTLEDHLGQRVEFFAAPHGLLSDAVVQMAWKVGYRAVCGTRSLPAHPQAPVLGRICVYRETTQREFQQLLERNPVVYGGRALRWLAYTPVRLAKKYGWVRRAGRGVRRALSSGV